MLQSLQTRKMSEDGSLAAYMHVAYLVFSASSHRGSNMPLAHLKTSGS